jgi:hypothetical protein
MSSKTTVTADVVRYADGERVGSVEMDVAEWEQYAGCSHPAYQWPGGIARAGGVLTPKQVEALGIDPMTTIWLE